MISVIFRPFYIFIYIMVINSLVLVYESRSLSLVDMKSEGSNIYVIKNGKTCDKEFLCKNSPAVS